MPLGDQNISVLGTIAEEISSFIGFQKQNIDRWKGKILTLCSQVPKALELYLLFCFAKLQYILHFNLK